MDTHIRSRTVQIAVLSIAAFITALPLQSAYALFYPPYRTDEELHGLNQYGDGTYVYKTKTTLSTNNPQWWAKSYVVEMIVTSAGSGAVGAGWAHFINNNNILQDDAVRYLYDANTGHQSYEFDVEPSANPYSAWTRED